jgi:hypothetical protein
MLTSAPAPSLESDAFIVLRDVPDLLPRRRGNSKLAYPTLWRWVNRGCRAADGTRVKLRIQRIGHQPVTTRSWLNEFFSALAQQPDDTAPTIRSPARRDREVAASRKRLAAAGI